MQVVRVEDLLNQIEDDFDGVCVYDVTPSEAINDFENSVYSAGVFNIVNCNECKYCITHYFGSLGYYCARDYNEFRVEPNGFCSWGKTEMLTQEQLIDYIENNYGFHLMEYQKTALWQFYKKWRTDKDFAFTYGRSNGRMFTYKLMKELLEYEH